ncbi:hypothetical protein DERP_001424 [Dermatophagoides pteronyssinus]|uniref:Gustatory receptor n=1 Tax=Dermatophagoides pteronyssinus TaxID=6956 RepID=A0ABQ8JEF0_DERPT|nr:hypothetical protein DERP_001424 [Dermatophagoides pteronyssinus]
MADSDLGLMCRSLTKFFGMKYRNKHSILMICLGILIWIDYINLFFNFIRSIDADIDEDCFLLEMGCVFFGKRVRVVGDLLMISYRTILFLMYNRWYLDDQQWLRMVNLHYDELVKEDIHLPLETVEKTVRKAFTITITVIILFNVSYFLIQNSQIYDRLLTHLYISLSTYLSGFFLTLPFILNDICASLLRQYYQRFHLHLTEGSLKPQFVQTFWNLYLMIQYAKVFLKESYMIVVGCLFASVLEIYYFAFYSDIHPVKRYICAILLFLIIQNIISFSVVFGQIDHEANALSDLAYEYVNVRRFHNVESNYKNNMQPKVGYAGYSKLPEMIDCLNQTLGVEVMNTPINAATIIKFISAFFSIVALMFQHGDPNVLIDITKSEKQ